MAPTDSELETKVEMKSEIDVQVIPMTDQIRRLQTIIRDGFFNLITIVKYYKTLKIKKR